MSDSIFTQIVKKKIPSWPVYEDEQTLAILDIHPVNKGHVLIFPKEQYRNIYDIPEELFAHMMVVAKHLAKAMKDALKADGINFIMNNEPAAGQMVTDHAHVHIIPRFIGDGYREWHGIGSYNDGEGEEFARRIREKCK